MDVLMPQLGETVAEGKLTKWLKKVGDVVAAGELLFEIETDKTSMEVPTMVGGVIIEIRVQEGETVPVSSIVARIEGDNAGENAGRSQTAAVSPAVTPPLAVAVMPTAASALVAQPVPAREIDPFNAVVSPAKNFGRATLSGGIKITPLARRLAAQSGIDASRLQGSGPRGRITAADVSRSVVAPAASSGGSPPMGVTADQVMAIYKDVPHREIPLDGMRKTIARRLVESKQTVPHFYLTTDVSIEELLDVRTRINASAAVRVSVNDFVVKAYALALQNVPAANSVFAGDRVLQLEQSDVGVAVSVEGGLFTPIVRNAQAKSLSTISAEIKDLARRAKERKLTPGEYQGGSAAVSNLGMFGVREFAAIINPPQATILAVGAGERRPVETEGGGMRWESKMTVTLSVDHRVVDGALGAELLAAFKAIVENPLSILL